MTRGTIGGLPSNYLSRRSLHSASLMPVFADILFRMLLTVGIQPLISYRASRSKKSDISFSTEIAGYLAMLVRVSAVYFWAFVKGWS